MYKEALEKYRKGFKMLLPFILLKMLYQISKFKFTKDKYGMITEGEELFRNMSGVNVKHLIASNIILIIIVILIVPLFYSFLYLVIKRIVKDEEINYKEAFDESLQFYLRYFTLNIIIIALFIGILLLAAFSVMIPFLVIAVGILFVYLVITIIPCEAYLIYNDVSAEEAFSKGRAVGRKYFWKLVLILVITVLMVSILDVIPDTNIIVYIIKSFIDIFIGFYIYVFSMVLCKKEE